MNELKKSERGRTTKQNTVTKPKDTIDKTNPTDFTFVKEYKQ